ncbi:hypothetical protein BX666DRAFT_2011545 [Dichotomocladium elegans]|nr:hypothetical protein BX666DRAFT_2011545 [Dichotomocladium elegans]
MSSNLPHSNGQTRHVTIETPVKTCEPCRRRKRQCNGARPCSRCSESHIECAYSVVSELPRSVFTTNTARRLSSGSACETCRRRKTKCDGGSPCGFCSSTGIECVNNSERRKRALGIPSTAPQPTNTVPQDPAAIDRIEDRLRRIERLMTAFSPSTNGTLGSAQASVSPLLGSSPPSSSARVMRQHRHSVQGISVAKEQAELHTAYALKKKREGPSPPPSPFRQTPISSRYATPPNSGSKGHYSPPDYTSSPPPSSLSPIICQTPAQPLTSSMFNLTLSPSSSTSSTSNNSSMLMPPLSSSLSAAVSTGTHHGLQPSAPAPQTGRVWGTNENEWKVSVSTMPSLMDQLSKRTFGNTPQFTFPPYPLSPPHSHPRQQSTSPVE